MCTGETYEDIAKMWDDQPRNDWEHLGDMMHDYRGMLAGWPGILQVHAVSLLLTLHDTPKQQVCKIEAMDRKMIGKTEID